MGSVLLLLGRALRLGHRAGLSIALTAAAAFSAHAAFSPNTPQWRAYPFNPPGYPTLEAACAAIGITDTTNKYLETSNPNFEGSYCTRWSGEVRIWDRDCPVNSTYQAGACVCNTGTTQSGPAGQEVCTAPQVQCPPAGTVAGSSDVNYDAVDTTSTGRACTGSPGNPGCTVQASSTVTLGGATYGVGPWRHTGQSCSGNAPDPTAPDGGASAPTPSVPSTAASAPQVCGLGFCAVGNRCVPCTWQTVPGGGDGSSSAPQTTCTGDTCVTNPPGGASGTSSSGTFCEQNPQSSLCGGNGTGSGSPHGPGANTPGEGDGEGEGEGEGDEPCTVNSSQAGCGGTAAPVSDLYTPRTDTLSSVVTTFRTQALATPMGSAVGSFFTVSGGGTCPTWSASIPYIEFEWSLSEFCSDFAAQALLLLRAAVLIVCSFFAFRVAIDN